ncbi:MAG: hypothetical protein RLZZ383_34 [Pseudomonadota bacterium]|jgi:hypothetical protein
MRVFFFLGVFACSRAAPYAAEEAPQVPTSAVTSRALVEPTALDGAAGTAGVADAAVVAAPRQVVRRATLAVVVDDVAQGVEEAVAVAEARGGFVDASEILPEGPYPHAELTLRIPADRLDEAMDAVASAALRVDRRALTSDDVTEAVVDADAALTNQRVLEGRLRTLLGTASGVDEVLAVEAELARVRQTIDATEARLRGLQGQVALSTLHVSFGTGGAASVVASWSPSEEAEAALAGLVGGVRRLATLAIWLVLCVGPLALVVGLPIGLWRRWARPA